ncbi:MAG TPA: hypothetical protein VHP63_07090 [candidate division Zixibacteria bacterium]|nr:hypothetical protein [candidate division Zixibacteria bacterium]
MNKHSRSGIIVLLFLLFIVGACTNDITIPPQPTLEGLYAGIYKVTTGYQSPAEEITISTIEMLFTDEVYRFNSLNIPDAFCSPYGEYVLSANNIEFDETQRNCAGAIANESDNPRGQFSIRRPGDSAILVQLDTVSFTFRQIQLKKK